MTYLLVVMFHLNGTDQPPVFVDGMLPLHVPSAKVCEERLEHMEDLLTNMDTPPFVLKCYVEMGKSI